MNVERSDAPDTEFLRRIARAVVRREDLARDAVQDALLAAHESPPRNSGASLPWLVAVVRKRAADMVRRDLRRTRRERLVFRQSHSTGPAQAVEEAEIRQRIARAVHILHEPYREAILLRYYEDLRPQEVAEALGVPLETARTRLRRGLASLRARLHRELKDDDRGVPVLLAFAGSETGSWPPGKRPPVRPVVRSTIDGVAPTWRYPFLLVGVFVATMLVYLVLTDGMTIGHREPPSPPRVDQVFPEVDSRSPRMKVALAGDRAEGTPERTPAPGAAPKTVVATVSGIARDTERRLPLAGTEVSLIPANRSSEETRHTVTNAGGHYEFREIPRGIWTIDARLRDHAFEPWREHSLTMAPILDDECVVLRNEDRLSPRSGARALVIVSDAQAEVRRDLWMQATDDRTVEGVLSGPEGDAKGRIPYWASVEWKLDLSRESNLTDPREVSVSVLLQNPDGRPIRTRVVGPDGRPVSVVTARISERIGGHLVPLWSGLAVGGWIDVDVRASGPVVLSVSGARDELGRRENLLPRTVEISTEERVPAHVQLESGVQIEGVVVDSRNQGVPGVRIQADGFLAWSDVDGQFALRGLREGEQRLHVSPPSGWVGQQVVPVTGHHRNLTITVREAGSIEGVAIPPRQSSRGLDRGAVVRAWAVNGHPSSALEGSLTKDGAFHLWGLDPELMYVVSIWAPDRGLWGVVESVRVGTESLDVVLEGGRELTGSLLHTDHGHGSEMVILEGESWTCRVLADSTGQFTFAGIPPGRYRVRAHGVDLQGRRCISDTVSVDLQIADKTVSLTVCRSRKEELCGEVGSRTLVRINARPAGAKSTSTSDDHLHSQQSAE